MLRLLVPMLCLLSCWAESQRLELHPDLVLELPVGWQRQESTSGMRTAQYALPGNAELVVYYFGPNGAGSVEANLQRWIDQFAAEGRVEERSEGEGEHGPWHLLQLTGTYQKPVGPPMMGKTQAEPESALLGIIVPSPQGPYYLKLTGPEGAVLPHRKTLETAVSK